VGVRTILFALLATFVVACSELPAIPRAVSDGRRRIHSGVRGDRPASDGDAHLDRHHDRDPQRLGIRDRLRPRERVAQRERLALRAADR
jgi:hypothetical protein